MRKELAWLRRGPPARTSKPKFRIEAANALIADEPPARDSTELLRFASSRLGNKVLEAEDISYGYGGQSVINHLTWRIGPGDRLALVGANGSGKSTLLRLLAGELTPAGGEVGAARRSSSRTSPRRRPRSLSTDDGARGGRGDPQPRDARRWRGAHRRASWPSGSASAARSRAPLSATSPAASAGA